METEPGEVVQNPTIPVFQEEVMENDAYLQNRHKDVKKWYNSQPELKQQYGRFPLFWQDLRDWKPWKSVDSAYSQYLQQDLEQKGHSIKRSRWTDASSMLKRSRWDKERRYIQPGLSVAISSGLISIEQVQEIMLRVRVRDLTNRIDNAEKEAEEISKDPNRSPSPPPIYDAAGNRTNTRALRIRRSLDIKRSELIEEILLLNPTLRVKHHCKYQRKVYIPQDQFPDYNFIGQIMGPRGNSHRNLERKTQTKILVRGQGSSRDGKESIDGIGRDEPPHVIITGDNEEGVKAAEEVIREICSVKDDKVNEYKKAQMRELAIINGQLFEGVICSICGERGHNQYQCPERPKSWKPANVVCKICGETSHLTKDCPQRHNKEKVAEMREQDHAYLEFMNELEGKKPYEKEEKEEGVIEDPLYASGGMMGQSVNGMMGQSVNGMMGQSVNGMMGQSVNGMMGQSVNGLMGQSVNGMMGQSVNGIMGQSVNGLMGQSVNPMMGQPVNPMMSQSVNPMMGQPVNPMMGQPVNTMMNQTINPMMNQPVNPMMNQPINPMMNQPNNPILNQPINPPSQPPPQNTPIIRPGCISYAQPTQTYDQQTLMKNMQTMFSFMMQNGMIPPFNNQQK